MIKDYAKKYANFNYKSPKRKKTRYFWVIFGIASLFVLSLIIFKLTEKKLTNPPTRFKLKKEIIVPAPIPKPPEPKFDFYNILPQDNSLPAAMLPVQRALPVPNEMSTSIRAPLQKPLDAMLNTTPEQVAIAEAKKRLDQEMGQHDAYVLILGNFTNVVAAEQLQAQALLKGFPVKKKQNVINGKSMVQIFIGPLSESKISGLQKRLTSSGLVGMAVKVSSGPA